MGPTGIFAGAAGSARHVVEAACSTAPHSAVSRVVSRPTGFQVIFGTWDEVSWRLARLPY